MSQIFEALRKAESLQTAVADTRDIAVKTGAERRRSKRRPIKANVRIYGHGPGMNPFYEENPILNVSAEGALLLLKVPVTVGQKLLLVNEATGQAQECRVLRTACGKTDELEVAVAFAAPHPEFWDRLEEKRELSGIEKRALPRVALPRGMNVTWRGNGESLDSRVLTISAGGLSIATPEPPGVGELIQLRFDVPAGEVNARAIVRHARQGEGMGVEFIAISQDARDRLDLLLRKLLT
jgi:PilZ domain-containing protein